MTADHTTDPVPPGERRSRWDLTALWVTFAGGFTFLFLGFSYHEASYPLSRAVAAGALGALAYLAYALPAAQLGATTGQTLALLTRSVLGVAGSALVTALLVAVAAGWTAVAFNMLASFYDGLFGWGHVALVGAVLAVLGIAANLFGFTGIAAFARYVAAPLLVVWVVILVVKGFTTVPANLLREAPAGLTDLPFVAGIGVAIGALAWGNEPDTWRYAAPRRWWPVLPYAVALAVGPVLCVAGGWMMAELSGEGPNDVGPALRSMVEFSLFGALWLGAVVATALQVAAGNGRYYQLVNAGQNALGRVRGWHPARGR